jgi:surfeit locus 1 family protein
LEGTKSLANYRFKPALLPTLATLVLLPLFVSLGLWQLHRADEKTALMRQREERQSQPALHGLEAFNTEASRYRRVELAGEFDTTHQFLLDNQVFNQQAGYLVLTPLRIAGTHEAVLVNRGWVPVGADRRRLPEVALDSAEAHINGLIDHFPGVGFKLKGAEIPSPGWPSVVQLLDAERLSKHLGYRLLPYQVLLAADEPGGYARDWKQASLNPEKNRGYALQWFSFASVLAGLYVWFGFKPKQTD